MASSVTRLGGQIVLLAFDRTGRRQERDGDLDQAMQTYRRAALLATTTEQPWPVTEAFLRRAALAEARHELRVVEGDQRSAEPRRRRNFLSARCSS